MTPDNLRAVPCHGHPFSNDSWSREEVQRLRFLLSNQKMDRERAAGLVIGAGGLPYILGYMGVSHLTVMDQYPEVTESVQGRIELLEDVESWEEYGEAVEAGLDYRMRKNFRREFRIATESGLRTDFACTQDGAAGTQMVSHIGNMIYELPRLAKRYEQQDRTVSFVNITNAGLCIKAEDDPSPSAGRRALAGLLRELPLLDRAVIIESGPSVLHAHARTAEEYFQAVGCAPLVQ